MRSPRRARAVTRDPREPLLRQTPTCTAPNGPFGGHVALGRALVDGLKPHYPSNECALCVAGAQLTEHAGEHDEAARLYAEAPPAGASSGTSRSGRTHSSARGAAWLPNSLGAGARSERRALLAAMGYEPALAETEALLALTRAASAP